jgi:hypothetical protein
MLQALAQFLLQPLHCRLVGQGFFLGHLTDALPREFEMHLSLACIVEGERQTRLLNG